jgi:long-chain acyl-CoA synthetase
MNERTLFSVLDDTANRYPDRPALHQPTSAKKGEKYRIYTWGQFRDATGEIACGLRASGLGKGDVIALDSETRAEFYLADLAVLANGSISAALYTSLPFEERAQAIVKSEAKAIFAEDPKDMRSLREASAPLDSILWILLTGEGPGAITLAELRERGRKALSADPGLFDRICSEVRASDPAILYLTSGATGQPKMGITSHQAVVRNIEMGPQVLPLGPDDVTLVFLPSAHIAQRVVLEFLPIFSGAQIYFSEGLSRMPVEIRDVRPTFLLAPPRVWERIYSNITTEIRKRPAITRQLFYTALGLGLKAAHLRHEAKQIPGWMKNALKMADRLVFRKIRARLGGRLRIAASGAAPLGQDLSHFYEAIGLPLIEGYGLTEAGIVAFNPIGNPRSGSIGKPLPGIEVKLADDGELLIKGPCLFSGYYNDPDATSAVMRDGWFHSGDVAEIDSNGYIYITGRKKELIVSSNGKKIYPSRIESLFKMEPIISQMIVVGDRQPYVTALFTLNPAIAESVKGPMMEEVGKVVKRVNQHLAPFEQIKRFRILDRELSIENGELTPTMKVRRTQVLENFRSEVNELYLGREEMN